MGGKQTLICFAHFCSTLQVFRKAMIKMSAGQALIMATLSLAFVRDSPQRYDTDCWMTIRMADALRLWERHHNPGVTSLY